MRRLAAAALLTAACVVCLLGVALSKSATATLTVGIRFGRIATNTLDARP
jgi:hypothetical protein